MSTQPGTLELIIGEIGPIFAPLESRLSSTQVLGLFAELGIQFPPALLDNVAFTSALDNGVSVAAGIHRLLDELAAAIDGDDTFLVIQKGIEALKQFATLFFALDEISRQLEDAAATVGISAEEVTNFARQLPRRLLDFIVVEYLERIPAVANTLQLLGVIERILDPGVPDDPAKPEFEIKRLHLSRLVDLIRSPAEYVEVLYEWGSSTFDGHLLLQQLHDFFARSGFPAALVPATPAEPLTLQVAVFDLRPDATLSPPGLELTLQTPIEADLSTTVPLNHPAWTLQVITSGQFSTGLVASIRPPADFALLPPTGTLDGQLLVKIVGELANPDQRIVLLGQTGASWLEAGRIDAILGMHFIWDGTRATGESHVEAEIVDGKLVIDASKGEGVLAALTSGLHFEAAFDVQVAWRPSTGLRFSGSSTFEIRRPVNFSLGPVEVQSIVVRLSLTASDGLRLELSGTVRITLGPLSITVDGLGFEARLTFPPRGNLGPADLDPRFKPPEALGILLNAGAISGGGFVQRQAGPPERYAGALALRLTAFGVVAFGLFERTPSGRMAFVVVLGIRFFPGIQLGFGFTLIGVGGLIGINRRADVDALRERLVSGAAGNVLFAEDPVRNAPTLLGDLGLMFPAADGVYIVGPTLQISWLTFGRLDLGIIIELPGPSRILLLGVMRFVIGAEDSALTLVQIRLDIFGNIDFVKKLVSFDAVLVNSRLLQIYQLTGNAAFRLSTGDRPYVVLTIGGFHPAFNPEPAVLPPIGRVALTHNMSQGVRIWMRLEAYLAITSNTFQLGAALELGIEAGSLNAVGFLTFDALIQFEPFYFAITFSAGFRVRWGSISLASVRVDGSLTGPGPIVISARLSIEFLFFEVSWSDSFTLGEGGGDQVRPISSLVVALTPELENPANLQAAESDDRQVSIVPTPSANKAVVAPQGQLIWSQKRAPLNVTLERLEGTPLSQPQAVQVVPDVANSPAQDWFSPGTYINLSQSEALNRAPFDRLEAGVRLGFDFKKSATVTRTITIETIRLPEERFLQPGFVVLFPSLLLHAIAGRTAPGRVFASTPIVGVRDEAWAVQDRHGGAIGTAFSQTEAHQQARRQGATALPAMDAADAIDLGGI